MQSGAQVECQSIVDKMRNMINWAIVGENMFMLWVLWQYYTDPWTSVISEDKKKK